MADNPVPDLFCPEILSDLDDIENYYVEHLKDQPKLPSDSLLDHIGVDDVPQQDVSLCETWDESWWKNSQENDDILTVDEDTPSLASQDDSTASAYSPCHGGETSDETASQLLNEILNNCQGHYEESQESSTSVVPTQNSIEYAFLNTETDYLLSVVPSLITTADLLPCASPTLDGTQASGSNRQSNDVTESSQNCNGTPMGMTANDNDSCSEVPEHGDASEREQGGAPVQAVDDPMEDDMALSESLQPPREQIENRATNSQVVPNLQMMLLAHREVDNAEIEEHTLEFHRSGSQADDENDSQVVPFWDQEE